MSKDEVKRTSTDRFAEWPHRRIPLATVRFKQLQEEAGLSGADGMNCTSRLVNKQSRHEIDLCPDDGLIRFVHHAHDGSSLVFYVNAGEMKSCRPIK